MLFSALPADTKQAARKAYRLWLSDPRHPSLHFKQVDDGVWSVRISLQFRALGVEKNGDLYWHWMGSHAEYDRWI